MRLYAWLLVGSSMFGQTLSVSSPAAQAGKPVEVDVSYAGAGAVTPTALEWVVTIPTSELTIVGTGPAVGPASTAAGKSLTCRGSWKKAPSTYSYHCILAGGQMPVADGVVAILHLQMKASAKAGVRPVDLEDASGVTADAKKIQVRKDSGKLSVSAGSN